MKLTIQHLDISTGDVVVATVHHDDAAKLDIHNGDRILLKQGRKQQVAVVNVTASTKLVKKGTIGLFNELAQQFPVKSGSLIDVKVANKPESLQYIKKKLHGQRLSAQEIRSIVDDIVHDRLTAIEMTYFVASTYVHELSIPEVVELTNAIIDTGNQLKLSNGIVVDKHCIGGVAGNRTTMVVVPIVAAAGLIMPKTSSRSITSPAGTADTMEVLAGVSFDITQLKRIIKEVGACMVWGGAVNLAPADDKIIRVEHPVSLDPVGQLLASILAKKKSVGATHLLIDIPLGKGAKIESKDKAEMLKRRFLTIGRKLGFIMDVVITDGSQPIGNGIGPALEARDVLKVLRHDKDAPQDLYEKSVELAGRLLELARKAPKGKGRAMAEELIRSGKAHEKMMQIIIAQGGKIITPEQIPVGKHRYNIPASKQGKITFINGKNISKLAKIAGAPVDQGAGIFLRVHLGERVKKGQSLMTIYAESKEKLGYAKEIIAHTELVKLS